MKRALGAILWVLWGCSSTVEGSGPTADAAPPLPSCAEQLDGDWSAHYALQSQTGPAWCKYDWSKDAKGTVANGTYTFADGSRVAMQIVDAAPAVCRFTMADVHYDGKWTLRGDYEYHRELDGSFAGDLTTTSTAPNEQGCGGTYRVTLTR